MKICAASFTSVFIIAVSVRQGAEPEQAAAYNPKDHYTMIQVQSSWFPLFDRNPQQFVDTYHAKDEAYRQATQRIYRSASAPSFVSVQVLR